MEKDIKKPQIRFQGFTEEWEQHKLGDYCEMYNGDRSSKYPNASDMVDDGIPFINAGDLENGSVNLKTANNITREKYNQLCGAKLQIGDIVYCLRGTLGKNAFIDNFEEGTIASSLVAIRPKNIDGRYLYYILNSDIEYRQRIVHDEGAAQPNLSAKSVSEFEIPILSIGEQKKISEYFTKFDHLISFHQRKYDSLVKVKKSMLEKMFPRSGAKKPEIRFVGFTDDWEQRKLGDVLDDLYNGQTPSRFRDDYWNGEISWLSSGELNRGIVNFSLEKITKEGKESANLRVVPKGTFVMSITGLEAVGTRGNCAILGFDTTINQSCMALYPKKDKLTSEFLFQWYRMVGEHYGVRFTQGTKQQSYNAEIIKDLNICLPKIDEQNKITTFLKKIDNLITLHQRKLNLLKNIKKAMLEKMFV